MLLITEQYTCILQLKPVQNQKIFMLDNGWVKTQEDAWRQKGL